MQFAQAARVDLFLAVREVRVLAVLLRAAAGEVLDHGGDAVRAEALALEAADVRPDEFGGEGGVGAEGAELPGPAGLGGEVDLRVQGDPQADGQVLLAGDVGEAVHQFGVADGGQADRLGPGGEGAGPDGGADVEGEGVPGVGGDRHRDAEPGVGGDPLHGVVPLGEPAGLGGADQVEVVDPLTADQAGGVGGEVGVVAVRGLDRPAVGVHRDHGVEEQAGLLLQGHPGQQVGDPFVDGPGRVLVRVNGGGGAHNGLRGGSGRTDLHRTVLMGATASAPSRMISAPTR